MSKKKRDPDRAYQELGEHLAKAQALAKLFNDHIVSDSSLTSGNHPIWECIDILVEELARARKAYKKLKA